MRALLFALVSILPAAAAAAEKAKAPAPQKPLPSQEELDKQFEQSLSGATLVGHYTVNGNEEASLKTERYKITKVSKMKGDTWLFEANMQWGKHDVTLPMPLTVKWAGDTPMITMTEVSLPGLGTYSARVLFYGGQYAGTWSAGSHGGQLFGELVKDADSKLKTDEKPKADEAK
jgi:hypothetical protein